MYQLICYSSVCRSRLSRILYDCCKSTIFLFSYYLSLILSLFYITMSQSQQSIFSSSIYEGDIDSLAYVTSDTSQSFTPDLSVSQQTLDSFDPDFLRPPLPPTIPSSLTRVGPGRNKAYVLYDEMLHSDWVSWWLETGFGKKGNILWDSNHQSSTWNEFHQVAHSSDGAAKVMCKRCGQILEHPNFIRETKDGKKQRQGTSTMKNHLNTLACKRAAQGQNTGITKFLRKGVGFPLPYLLRFYSNHHFI